MWRFGVAGLVALLAGVPAGAASFDCDQPGLTLNERAICDHRDLNDADVRMVTTLRLLSGLFAMGMRGEIQDAQAVWLRQRMACGGDVACIRAAYARRLGELDALYQAIDRPI